MAKGSGQVNRHLFNFQIFQAHRPVTHIESQCRMHYTSHVEYPFPPVGIVGAADGKNRRAFFF